MIKISFGQAILILLNKHMSASKYDGICDRLKSIYISGIDSEADYQFVMTLANNTVEMSPYQISIEPEVINEDCSRRYFETTLAYATLAETIHTLNMDDIKKHYESLYGLLPEDRKKKYDDYCSKRIPLNDDRFAPEYIDAFDKVMSDPSYSDLTIDNKLKLIYLLKSSWVGIILSLSHVYPIDIYGTGLYEDTRRGRTAKPNNNTVATKNTDTPLYSNNFGLMKSYMAVPQNDRIYSKTGFSFFKPADSNTCNPESDWPKLNFAKLTHPFSCGISSTVLGQLRMMKHFHNNNQLLFNNPSYFMAFMKCYFSGLLFNSGGHSYNEFLAVFKLEEIQKAFQFIPGFNRIDAKSLFLDGNEKAFESALRDTINYHKQILAKKQVHSQIGNRFAPIAS